jgi:hypothetical protein
VDISAGATNTSSAGSFDDGASPNANVTVTYTGLVIRGGSGLDALENDAKNGIVTVGNGDDIVILGGARRPRWVPATILFPLGLATLGPMRRPVAPSAIV